MSLDKDPASKNLNNEKKKNIIAVKAPWERKEAGVKRKEEDGEKEC